MRTVIPWDQYFLDMCDQVAQRSKDPSTQVGAVITRDRHVLSVGYNGFPTGVAETTERWTRPLKYDFVCHAEANAITTAARYGHGLDGATLYASLMPCAACAKLLAQAGIRRVVVNGDKTAAHVGNDWKFDLSTLIFAEAGISLEKHHGQDPSQQL